MGKCRRTANQKSFALIKCFTISVKTKLTVGMKSINFIMTEAGNYSIDKLHSCIDILYQVHGISIKKIKPAVISKNY